MKSKSLDVLAVTIVSVSSVVAVAGAMNASREFAKDKIVDAIMEVGDRYVHGPFKKGGGDEPATRQLISDLVEGGNPYRIFVDLTFKGQSRTASREQDRPGFSQEHGVLMPSGAKVQTPEETAHSSQSSSLDHVHEGLVAGGGGGSESTSQTATQESHTVWLRAGETNYQQVNSEPKVNLNPEHATANAPPAAAAAAPAPTPAATPAPPDTSHGNAPEGRGPSLIEHVGVDKFTGPDHPDNGDKV